MGEIKTPPQNSKMFAGGVLDEHHAHVGMRVPVQVAVHRSDGWLTHRQRDQEDRRCHELLAHRLLPSCGVDPRHGTVIGPAIP